MGEGRNLKTPLTVVSFIFLHQVYRGLKRGRSDYGCQRSNGLAGGTWQLSRPSGNYRGESVSDNVSPPILVLTPKN